MRYIICSLIVLACLNSCSQNSNANTKDDPTSKLSAYRQNFWDSLPKPTDWVSDYDSIYSYKQILYLDSIINKFKKETGGEIAVISVDTMCVASEDFEKLILHIANTWGVGEKEKNNGVLIAICKDYRKMRIEIGTGIKMNPIETKKIIDSEFTPYFKTGQYYEGTVNGLGNLIAFLKAKMK